MTSREQHWESVYRTRDPEAVGWYQTNPARSLRLIEACGVGPDAPIVDIGGGCSLLVDRILDEGYRDVTILDLSATALDLAKERLGSRADSVTWIEADVTAHQFDRMYQVWHDRAAFHFLTDADGRARYINRLRSAVGPAGFAVIATFSLDGPEHCSGLPVWRYDEESLCDALGSDLEPVAFEHETHRTPGGSDQEFLYGCFRRRSN